ncbi:MAG: hypothetical protein HQM08_24085 [Candidatus Riflebacteria bacterium]|nr:hypothetical protein [Candidatus Riflebacteria bacterium]
MIRKICFSNYSKTIEIRGVLKNYLKYLKMKLKICISLIWKLESRYPYPREVLPELLLTGKLQITKLEAFKWRKYLRTARRLRKKIKFTRGIILTINKLETLDNKKSFQTVNLERRYHNQFT